MIKDQLCYEADLNLNHQDKYRLSEDNYIGLTFLVDTNKDRKISKDLSKLNDMDNTFGINILNMQKHVLTSFYPSAQFHKEDR